MRVNGTTLSVSIHPVSDFRNPKPLSGPTLVNHALPVAAFGRGRADILNPSRESNEETLAAESPAEGGHGQLE